MSHQRSVVHDLLKRQWTPLKRMYRTADDLETAGAKAGAARIRKRAKKIEATLKANIASTLGISRLAFYRKSAEARREALDPETSAVRLRELLLTSLMLNDELTSAWLDTVQQVTDEIMQLEKQLEEARDR